MDPQEAYSAFVRAYTIVKDNMNATREVHDRVAKLEAILHHIESEINQTYYGNRSVRRLASKPTHKKRRNGRTNNLFNDNGGQWELYLDLTKERDMIQKELDSASLELARVRDYLGYEEAQETFYQARHEYLLSLVLTAQQERDKLACMVLAQISRKRYKPERVWYYKFRGVVHLFYGGIQPDIPDSNGHGHCVIRGKKVLHHRRPNSHNR